MTSGGWLKNRDNSPVYNILHNFRFLIHFKRWYQKFGYLSIELPHCFLTNLCSGWTRYNNGYMGVISRREAYYFAVIVFYSIILSEHWLLTMEGFRV